MMRRLVKEHLLKFDETPLFPERRAYSVNYVLSDAEASLYREVTDYVRNEFNRAEALQNDGRRGTIGFALTILQRRLASSPEAIYQSLRRRKARLEKRLREEKLLKRGATTRVDFTVDLPALSEEDFDDLDESPSGELEEAEEQIVDQATAAQTIAELEAEIAILAGLEKLAKQVRLSEADKKWEELSSLLQDNEEMFDAHGHRRKLVIFTEHRDTLSYLCEKIRTLLGRAEAVVTIHGGIGREERKNGPKPVHSGQGCAGPRCHGRRGRRYQPPAGPPDGELRPALESQPSRTTLWSYPPYRSDRGLPPLESGCQRDPRGRRVPPAAGKNWRSLGKRSAVPFSTSWAEYGKGNLCENC